MCFTKYIIRNDNFMKTSTLYLLFVSKNVLSINVSLSGNSDTRSFD